MTRPDRCLPELAEILHAMTERTMTDEQFTRSYALPETATATRRFYVVCIDMHANLTRRPDERERVIRPAEPT